MSEYYKPDLREGERLRRSRTSDNPNAKKGMVEDEEGRLSHNADWLPVELPEPEVRIEYVEVPTPIPLTDDETSVDFLATALVAVLTGLLTLAAVKAEPRVRSLWAKRGKLKFGELKRYLRAKTELLFSKGAVTDELAGIQLEIERLEKEIAAEEAKVSAARQEPVTPTLSEPLELTEEVVDRYESLLNVYLSGDDWRRLYEELMASSQLTEQQKQQVREAGMERTLQELFVPSARVTGLQIAEALNPTLLTLEAKKQPVFVPRKNSIPKAGDRAQQGDLPKR